MNPSPRPSPHPVKPEGPFRMGRGCPQGGRGGGSWSRPAWLLAAWLSAVPIAGAADAQHRFLTANTLYEQGKYAQAAPLYEELIRSGARSPSVYFNLGNALWKIGQTGKAIANYRRAERLAPRDPDIQANLQFARNQLGTLPPKLPMPARWIQRLTLDEWALLLTASNWIWFGLLTAGQCRPVWLRSLRAYIFSAGLATLGAGLALGFTFYYRHSVPQAVVLDAAALRYGPLSESQAFSQLRVGTELVVLEQREAWIQVQDGAGRTGWMLRHGVALLN